MWYWVADFLAGCIVGGGLMALLTAAKLQELQAECNLLAYEYKQLLLRRGAGDTGGEG